MPVCREETRLIQKVFDSFCFDGWKELKDEFNSVISGLEDVRTCREELYKALNILRSRTHDYCQARYDLLTRALEKKGEGICTYGNHAVPLKIVKLAYINEVYVDYDLMSGFDETEYHKIYRICLECLKLANRGRGKKSTRIVKIEILKRLKNGRLKIRRDSRWQAFPGESGLRPQVEILSQYEISLMAERRNIFMPPELLLGADRERGGKTVIFIKSLEKKLLLKE